MVGFKKGGCIVVLNVNVFFVDDDVVLCILEYVVGFGMMVVFYVEEL